MFKNLFQIYNPRKDIFSGMTVSLALVPEAIAFAFIAGVDPLVGLYGAFIMGIVTAILGGRPGMISGATGAMAVVMIYLVHKGNIVGESLNEPIQHLGLQWLLIALLFVGGFQILFGVFKLGTLIRLIPYPVMMGFVNGLAIVIFLSQTKMFTQRIGGEQVWLTGTALTETLVFVLLTMLIIFLLSKFVPKIPAALISIAAVTMIVVIGDFQISTVGSFIRENGGEGMQGKLPSFQVEFWSLFYTLKGHWGFLLSTVVVLALIGLIESLMTLMLIDEIVENKGNSNKESIAQGVGNTLSGLFGGMGGCAMIGQSMININAEGRGRLSGIVAAVALLIYILFASSLIEQIPIAALVGVMFIVVIKTFAWSSFRIIHKIPKSDAFVLIAVSAITVWQDLAIAVISGVIISSLVFAWKNAVRIRARVTINEKGVKVYQIWGPLFFGSVEAFNAKFDVRNDPNEVEIDFIDSKIVDHSGVKAIQQLIRKYKAIGKKVSVKHLSPECQRILLKYNSKFSKVICETLNDPHYHILEKE